MKLMPISPANTFTSAQSSVLQKQNATQVNKNYATTPNFTSVSNVDLANSLNAVNTTKLGKGVSFGSGENLTDFERSIIASNEIRVDDLLNISEDVHISRKETPENARKLNSAGLNIVSANEDGFKKINITNDFGDTIFIGKIEENIDAPRVIYKQGKYMPEITIKDDSLDGSKVKMLAGSEIEGNGFKFVMPGEFKSEKGRVNNISFTGNVVISTLNKEPRTQNAVELYKGSELAERTIKGDYYDVVKDNDPTIMIPAGGFGERFHNLSRDVENKPSYKLPTRDEYRIIATTLNMAAASGILNGDNNDNISYLSQKHEIGGKNVYGVQAYKTDGGAIAEGISRDIIDNNKDLIVLNADIFTNTDPTRAYNALKTLPYAALVIPYYPVGPERAKAFGLLGTEKDESGNLKLKEFVEKPVYTSRPPMPGDFTDHGQYDTAMSEFERVQTARSDDDENIFFANPGMYFMSSEALKILGEMGVMDPNKTGLGADVMPKIVQMCNEGMLKDKDGNQLKAYTMPLEAKGGKPAFWDDIGTAEAYLKLIKNVAEETKDKGAGEANKFYGVPEFVLEDFVENTDLETGIVYGSKDDRKSFENFKEKYSIETAKGNMFIVK